MTNSLKDSYKYYKECNKGEKITLKEYVDTCVIMNALVSDWILEGNSLNLGSHMGRISIARYERRFRLSEKGTPILPVNWFETNKLRKEGSDRFVYHTDKFYCGWKWHRGECKIPGKGAFKFKASRTNGVTSKEGNINKLVKLLKSDELAYLRFNLIG